MARFTLYIEVLNVNGGHTSYRAEGETIEAVRQNLAQRLDDVYSANDRAAADVLKAARHLRVGTAL